MIDAVVFACLLIGCKVSGIFHHHNSLVVAFVAAADGTQFLIRQSKTLFTITDILLRVHHRTGQTFHLLLWHVNDVKCKSLG